MKRRVSKRGGSGMKRRVSKRGAIAIAAACAAGGLVLAASRPPAPGPPVGDAAPAPPEARPFDPYLGLEPRRHFSESVVDAPSQRQVFEPVLQGDEVHHRFRIPNPGAEPMEIRALRLCSGCILTSRSERVPPGREGHVAMVVPTDWLGGRGISDTITFETTAPALPRVEIRVELPVREVAALHPYRIWLEGAPGERVVATSVVVPNEDFPFAITGIRARKGIWFEHAYREIEHEGRRAWEIRLVNTREKPGPYQDVLFVQTDHPERPELQLRVEGRIGVSADGRAAAGGARGE